MSKYGEYGADTYHPKARCSQSWYTGLEYDPTILNPRYYHDAAAEGMTSRALAQRSRLKSSYGLAHFTQNLAQLSRLRPSHGLARNQLAHGRDRGLRSTRTRALRNRHNSPPGLELRTVRRGWTYGDRGWSQGGRRASAGDHQGRYYTSATRSRRPENTRPARPPERENVPSANPVATVEQVVAHPAVAVLVCVGLKVQDAGSVAGGEGITRQAGGGSAATRVLWVGRCCSQRVYVRASGAKLILGASETMLEVTYLATKTAMVEVNFIF